MSLVPSDRIEVVRGAQPGVRTGLKSRLLGFIRTLKEFRAYDTQKYVDMLVDEEFEVPSDHFQLTQKLKAIRAKI